MNGSVLFYPRCLTRCRLGWSQNSGAANAAENKYAKTTDRVICSLREYAVHAIISLILRRQRFDESFDQRTTSNLAGGWKANTAERYRSWRELRQCGYGQLIDCFDLLFGPKDREHGSSHVDGLGRIERLVEMAHPFLSWMSVRVARTVPESSARKR